MGIGVALGRARCESTFLEAIYAPSVCTGEDLLPWEEDGLSGDPLFMRHHSDSSCGSSVEAVEIAPIANSDCPVALPGCSVPTGVSLEKLFEKGHFRDVKMTAKNLNRS